MNLTDILNYCKVDLQPIIICNILVVTPFLLDFIPYSARFIGHGTKPRRISS